MCIFCALIDRTVQVASASSVKSPVSSGFTHEARGLTDMTLVLCVHFLHSFQRRVLNKVLSSSPACSYRTLRKLRKLAQTARFDTCVRVRARNTFDAAGFQLKICLWATREEAQPAAASRNMQCRAVPALAAAVP